MAVRPICITRTCSPRRKKQQKKLTGYSRRNGARKISGAGKRKRIAASKSTRWFFLKQYCEQTQKELVPKASHLLFFCRRCPIMTGKCETELDKTPSAAATLQ